jgi:hypothetical protein
MTGWSSLERCSLISEHDINIGSNNSIDVLIKLYKWCTSLLTIQNQERGS